MRILKFFSWVKFILSSEVKNIFISWMAQPTMKLWNFHLIWGKILMKQIFFFFFGCAVHIVIMSADMKLCVLPFIISQAELFSPTDYRFFFLAFACDMKDHFWDRIFSLGYGKNYTCSCFLLSQCWLPFFIPRECATTHRYCMGWKIKGIFVFNTCFAELGFFFQCWQSRSRSDSF